MVNNNVIPDDVRDFILENIDSIAQLEGLLLLRAEPQQKNAALTLAQRLYINESDAAELFIQLQNRGFLSATADDPPLYFYEPKSAQLEEMIVRVADIYARCLVPVTHLIHSKPKTKIQQFADAFWIRKE